MKVIFISPNYDAIVQVPKKDYPKTYHFFQSILDFKNNQYSYDVVDEIFLKDYGDWSVFLRTNNELNLKYIGNVYTRYKEAKKYIIENQINNKQMEKIESWISYLVDN